MMDKNRFIKIYKKEEAMKFKILSVVFVFALIFVIFAVGDYSLNAQTEMKITGNGFERMVREKIYTTERLIEIFKCRNVKLAQWYKVGKFEKIGKYFGKGGFIRTAEGVTYREPTEISKYFSGLKEQKVEEVKFETKSVNIFELTAVLNQDNKSPEDIVDIITEELLFSYGSGNPNNFVGIGVAMLYHPRRCDI